MTKQEFDKIQSDFEVAAAMLVNHRSHYYPGDPKSLYQLDRVQLLAKQEAFHAAWIAYSKAIRECMEIRLECL